jgi:hypothetical protein
VLTAGEKSSAILAYDVILAEQASITNTASAHGVSSAAYTAAVTALTNYLSTLNAPVLWSNLSGSTNIVGPTFRTKFKDVYDARQVMLNVVAARTATVEAGADVTASSQVTIDGVAEVTISADYLGEPTVSLPRLQPFVVRKGGVNVTNTAALSVAVMSGKLTAAISASGMLSLEKLANELTNSVVEITATVGVATAKHILRVTKTNAAPPPAPPGGGTTLSYSFAATTNGTTPVKASPDLMITIGATGVAELLSQYDFNTDASAGVYSLVARWSKWNGSAFVAIGTAVSATDAYLPQSGEPGVGFCNFDDTGNTSGSSQTYALFIYNNTGITTRFVGGDVAATGK